MIVYESMNLILETTFQIPKIGAGRYKNQLVLMNNLPLWKRWGETRIKSEFKNTLKVWALEQSTLNAKVGTLEFQLIRHDRRRQDADSIAFEGKWFADLLVELGYFEDDVGLTFVYRPVVYEPERVQPEVNVKVYSLE